MAANGRGVERGCAAAPARSSRPRHLLADDVVEVDQPGGACCGDRPRSGRGRTGRAPATPSGRSRRERSGRQSRQSAARAARSATSSSARNAVSGLCRSWEALATNSRCRASASSRRASIAFIVAASLATSSPVGRHRHPLVSARRPDGRHPARIASTGRSARPTTSQTSSPRAAATSSGTADEEAAPAGRRPPGRTPGSVRRRRPRSGRRRGRRERPDPVVLALVVVGQAAHGAHLARRRPPVEVGHGRRPAMLAEAASTRRRRDHLGQRVVADRVDLRRQGAREASCGSSAARARDERGVADRPATGSRRRRAAATPSTSAAATTSVASAWSGRARSAAGAAHQPPPGRGGSRRRARSGWRRGRRAGRCGCAAGGRRPRRCWGRPRRRSPRRARGSPAWRAPRRPDAATAPAARTGAGSARPVSSPRRTRWAAGSRVRSPAVTTVGRSAPRRRSSARMPGEQHDVGERLGEEVVGAGVEGVRLVVRDRSWR